MSLTCQPLAFPICISARFIPPSLLGFLSSCIDFSIRPTVHHNYTDTDTDNTTNSLQHINNMKYSIAASSLAAATLAAASPQFGGGNRGNPNGDNANMVNGGNNNWNGAPSCVSSCWQDLRGDSNDYSDFCTGDKLNTLNSCIADSDCDQSDKDATYQVIAQGCANAGQTVTASPQATFSATSGKNLPTPGGAGPWQGRGGDWTTNSEWQSWTSAHPTPAVTDAAAWSSWASSASWPTASSDWSSWASAKGLPSAVISGGGFPFAFGGPGPSSSVVSLLFDLAFCHLNPSLS